jgi:hypothetical protein
VRGVGDGVVDDVIVAVGADEDGLVEVAARDLVDGDERERGEVDQGGIGGVRRKERGLGLDLRRVLGGEVLGR